MTATTTPPPPLPPMVPGTMREVKLLDHLLRDKHGKDYRQLDVYKAAGGYAAAKKAITMGPDAVLAEMKKASVRGRGGAGFPAGIKWGFVPKDTTKPKYLVVNGDEGEPGTFKDNYYLSHDPHRLIEGCIICSLTLGIETVYIYIRGEFFTQIAAVEAAVAQCYAAKILGKNALGSKKKLDVYVHTGAGAYICGEETALLESLEGKPGQPRLKPPFPAVVGAFGCPTVINNVETLASVPLIIEHGADWFLSLGVERDGGSRIVGISGHVNHPGLFEVGVGVTLREMIYGPGGGISEGRALKAVIPGGSSCPVLKPDEIDIPMTVDAMAKAGTMLGTCGIIVIAEGTCLLKCLQRISHFYAHESCGQCTPCREGTGWMARIIDDLEAGRGKMSDIAMLVDIADQIGGNTICALGDAASLPVQSFVKKFRAEFEAHVTHGGCPHASTPLPGWRKPAETPNRGPQKG